MQVITRAEYEQKREFIVQRLAQGALAIFPTDTIYRVGCDATNAQAVSLLRYIKNVSKPFAVMAPSKQWIRKNCVLSPDADDFLDVLPGQYTLILRLRTKHAVAREITCGLDTIAVRMPRTWSNELAALLNKPLATTAANIPGQSFMTSLDTVPAIFTKHVDYCLYDGELQGNKIRVIDLSRELAVERTL